MVSIMSTTIAVSEMVRDELKEFGAKGESYDAVLQRILKIAKEQQLRALLLDTSDAIPIREALAEAKKRWP